MARRPLLSAALCAVLAAVVYAAAVTVPALRAADLRTLEGFMGLWREPVDPIAGMLVSFFNPVPFALLAGAITLGAVVAGRSRAGLVALVAMLGAAATTQVLKPLLATQREFPLGHFMGAEAYPSGHTTAVMSIALALVIVSPVRWRPLAAAAGGVLTVGTVYSILILGSHYPSDVIGGFLVATGWACLAAAALRPEARPSLRALAGGPALGGAVLAVLGGIAVTLRPEQTLAYAVANTTFVVGALAIAAGALALSGTVPVPTAARGRPPRR